MHTSDILKNQYGLLIIIQKIKYYEKKYTTIISYLDFP